MLITVYFLNFKNCNTLYAYMGKIVYFVSLFTSMPKYLKTNKLKR